MKVLLIGAGGHARVVLDALASTGFTLFAYVDPRPSPWLDAPRRANDEAVADVAPEIGVALGLGGTTPGQLGRRLELLLRYLAAGRAAPGIVHPRAIVAPSVTIGKGAQIMAGAIVHGGVTLGDAAIINTGAIVEHDSTIGAGTHVAPGAIVLGGVRIGANAMIGSGAILLPGATVAGRSLVPAGSVYGSPASRSPRRHAPRRRHNTRLKPESHS